MATPQPLAPTVDKGISHSGVVFLGVAISICVLSGACVAARVVSRVKQFRSLGKDDFTIILAWIYCVTIETLSTYWVATCGVGWSMSTLPSSQLKNFFKVFYGLQLLYTFAVFTAKISILFLYLRIFETPKFRMFAYSTLGLCISWFIASIIVAVFQCHPVDAAWNLGITGAKCIDKQKLFWGIGISNLLLDVLILCLPMPVIWGLKTNNKRKLALTGMFLTGSFVCVASILRVTSIGKIEESDFTKSVWLAALWSSIEANFAVIAACLPTFRHFYLRFKKQIGSHLATPVRDPEEAGLTRSQQRREDSGPSRKIYDPYSTDLGSSLDNYESGTRSQDRYKMELKSLDKYELAARSQDRYEVGSKSQDRYEMGSKMTGWKTGTNEAYVGTKSSIYDQSDDFSELPTPPFERMNVLITRQVEKKEAVAPS